jgi:hypothetical protein
VSGQSTARLATTEALHDQRQANPGDERCEAIPPQRVRPGPYPPRSTKSSAEDGRTGFRRRDPDQAAALFDHGAAIVVPVRMLPGDGAVVLDQRFHRLGQVEASTSPLSCAQSPKNLSLSTHNQARESRRTFKVFIADSRVLTTRRSCESTPTSTGDN